MKRQFSLRALSMLLAVAVVMGLMPMAVFASETGDASLQAAEQITTYLSTESTLAPGITQTVNSGYAADGKLINYYIAIADIGRDDVGVQASYKDAQCEVLGMSKMTEQAAAMNAKHTDPSDTANYIPHYAVVAGVNGDGYNTGNAKPSGAHVMNGVAAFGITKAGNSSWFAIFEDGTALCGANNADWDEAVAAHGPVQEAIGGFQLVRKNGVDVAYSDSSYLNDGRYPRSFVGVTADNKVVFMAVDGNGAGGSAGSNYAESLELMDEVGCTYILCLDGGGSATYISRPAGSSDIQVTSTPSDGSERAVSNGLVMYTTTPPSDTFEKAEITAESLYVTPGSQVKVSAIGISPAGTAAQIPVNAVWTATNGTVTDGVFVSDGTIGEAEVALTVDGEVVGSTTINVVLPDTIAFTRETMTVPFGATVELEVTAKYGLYDVVLKDGDITMTVADTAVGTVSGNMFTAAATGTGTTITATVNGVGDVADTIQIVLGKGSEVVFDFEAGSAGADLDNWATRDHGNNTHIFTDLSIVTEETGMVHDGESALAFNYHMDQAIHGTEFWAGNSIAWLGESIELKNATSWGFWLYIPEDCTHLAMWVGTSTHDENGEFAGKVGYECVEYTMDKYANPEYSGWHYISVPVTREALYIEDNADKIGQYYNGSQFKQKANCFIKFYAVNIDSWKDGETNYAGDFTFYIDNITVDYSDAVDDRENPIFSGMTYAVEGMSDAAALNGQTVTQDTVSFAGMVAEDMTNPNNASGLDASTAVAYIDGVQVDCEYAGGMITVSDAILTNGVHTIRMGICDKMGNYAETKRQIIVNAEGSDASVRVQPQDEDLIYMLNDSVYWIDVEVDAIETVQSVEMRLDLDSMNNWELDHIETLYGFDTVYSFATANDKAENILTIKFTRNGDYLAETGTVVIASLPIRVWEYVSSDDHTHKNAVEAWNCNYVCAPALSVDVDTEMGIVTYLDGTSHTFSSEDIHTLCVSYTYGLRMRDYDNAYYAAHSFHVHSAAAIADVAATCTESGHTGRTWCETCASPVAWGTTVPATGHDFVVDGGVLKCACGELYNGVYTDGKTYADGVILSGWIDDCYWQDGVMLTGIQQVDGYYYDFGTDGVCAGQVKYSGLFYDETVSAWRYAKLGELLGGWVKIGDHWHFFDQTTKVAVTGDYYYASRNITYHFDETGRTEGTWQKTAQGTRFWYGEWYYTARNEFQRCFVEIDGKTYNFNTEGYLTIGIHPLYDDWAANTNDTMTVWEFDQDGVLVGQIKTPGTIKAHDGMYLIEEDGYVHTRNARVEDLDGDIYFVNHSGRLVLDAEKQITAANSNGLLEPGTYYFDKDGKLFTGGIREAEDGNLYYYKNGQLGARIYNSKLAQIDGAVYFVKWSGKVAVNEFREITTANSNGLLTPGTYYFGADGKLFTGTGVVWNESEQTYYYCQDGKIGTRIYNSELVEINGAIYLVKWSGKVAADEVRDITAAKSNGLLEPGTYYFGEDGALFTGVKEGDDGILYYYQDGQLGERIYNSELVEIDGKIYLVKWSGKVAADEVRQITAANSNGLLAPGTYYFGEDGALFTGVKEGDDGILYYYQDGQLGERIYNSELVQIDGEIYLVKWSGKVAVNETREIVAAKSNGLLAPGTYYFGEDGKLQA